MGKPRRPSRAFNNLAFAVTANEMDDIVVYCEKCVWSQPIARHTTFTDLERAIHGHVHRWT